MMRLPPALLALLALAACALPPDGAPPPGAATEVAIVKPPPAPASPADLPGPACGPEHTQAIQAALVTARARMAAAVALIEREPNHPHVQRWFGAAPPAEVADRLRRTASWLAKPIGLQLRCNDAAGCGPAARMAYASPSRGVLGLCPSFFRAGETGFDTRWGVLIHEASHIAAGTRDHAYGPQAASILAKQDLIRAAENADNYEYFVETLPG
jgi:peptidyl-Lys metalloendopeptidase